MAKTRLITVNTHVLTSWSKNSSLVAEFPFLNRLKNLPKCPPCQRKKRPDLQEALNSMKKAIAGLDENRRQKLKTLVGVSKLRVVYKDETGRTRTKDI